MWTNDAPTTPGFYWYRESLTLSPQVIELDSFGSFTQTDYEGDMFTPMRGADQSNGPSGLFWSERLIPPD